MMNCYFVHEKDMPGNAVIADNRNEAIKLSYIDCDYIDIRANKIKNADIKNLEKGLVNPLEALNRKFFDYIQDIDCPNCGKKYATIFLDNRENIVCSNCELKIGEK